jgi:CheY-like chemotaxis protein
VLTILVVDDEPLMRVMMRRVLEQDGHAVLTAENGTDALSVFRSHEGEIDLLISDVSMPGMNGAELAAKLKADAPDLPVLLMSGFCDLECLRFGFEFIPKPFAVADLIGRVRHLARQHPTHLVTTH